jgi:hypothetical protein
MATKPMTAERLAEQKRVVEKAISGRMLNKYDGVLLIGENSRIIKAHAGELKNTHNAVFKNCLGKKTCEHCGLECRLDRAHMKSKLTIAKEVLDSIHPIATVPIDMKVFMTAFVAEHANVGVWMLCKQCHKELG